VWKGLTVMPDNNIHRKKRRWVHQLGHDLVDGFCNAMRMSDEALGVVVFVVVLFTTWVILSVLTG